MKKRPLLARLRTNGAGYVISALLLLLGAPLYQLLVLTPAGFGSALSGSGNGLYVAYLTWIGAHSGQFLLYRVLLILAFGLLISLPFSLYRIIVAQELLGQREREEEAAREEDAEEEETASHDQEREEPDEESDIARDAWRGKGFAIIAAWAGLLGLIVYVLGTAVSTVHLLVASGDFAASHAIPSNFASLSAIFSVAANTAGIGLLALSTLFFGAMIARSGRNLWPDVWVGFGYAALAVAALLSGSAVGAAGAPTGGQAPLTTPAILAFALWVLWFGVMLIRLKPE